MQEYQSLIEIIALTMGVAWASGINLYATLAVLGLAAGGGYIDLPDKLHIVQDPLVITAAIFMYCVEFFADKTPGVDTGWDALHTFIRIPAGALLAAGAVGNVDPALSVAAGLIGGTVTAATHTAKAGSRILVNTSPEPFSNWGASLAADVTLFGGLWLALSNPAVFVVAFIAFIALLIWVMPKLWRAIKHLFRKIAGWFRREPATV